MGSSSSSAWGLWEGFVEDRPFCWTLNDQNIVLPYRQGEEQHMQGKEKGKEFLSGWGSEGVSIRQLRVKASHSPWRHLHFI